MEVIKTGIEGVVVIEPRIFKDERGYFFESFSQREFNEKVMPVNFVQDNESMSSYGVMRGLHFQQMPYTQSKLVRCVKGAVLDVAVDIRKGSPTYGQHVAVELTEENHLHPDQNRNDDGSGQKDISPLSHFPKPKRHLGSYYYRKQMSRQSRLTYATIPRNFSRAPS